MAANSQHTGGFQNGNDDRTFIKRLEEEVEKHLNNDQFGVEELAGNVGMSRSNLHRKLQQYSGQSVSQFIREYRLRRGHDYLKKDQLTVSEAAYSVGFKSQSYFTSCFTSYFGYAPSEVKYKLTLDQRHAAGAGKQGEFNFSTKTIAGSLVIAVLIVAYFLFKPISDDDEPGIEKSLAVLPFKNLSDDKENEYFVEGVLGAITTNLSGIEGLNIISRTSTNKFRNSTLSARKIAEELHTTHLLEGSIQRQQSKIRIDVKLIEANSERQVWAASYDRELKEIFKTQSEIAEEIVITLKSKLTSQERTALNQSITQNPEAYDLYLKGIYQNRTNTQTGNNLSLKYFKQAIALDSGFALAYSGLALSYIAKASIFSAELEPGEAFSSAKPLLDKALELEPDQIQAHSLIGFYFLYNDWDFEKAEKQYKKAIKTNYPDALALYSDYLNFVGRHEEALEIAERLNRVHPHYPNSRMILALYYMGKYNEAEKFAEDRLRVYSNYYTFDTYGFLSLNTGHYQKAISLFQKAIDLEGVRYPRILGWMGAAYAKSGQKEKALELLKELKIRFDKNSSGSVAFFIAVIYTALDEKQSALQWVTTSFKTHEMEIPWLLTEPQFYPLHGEPAFQELVRKVGFPNANI